MRIVIIGPNWMGDVLFATPVIRALRKRYPSSYLAFSSRASCLEVLKGNPHLDERIPYDEKPFLTGLGAHMAFLKRLRQGKFDAAICLHASATRLFLCGLAGIGRRIGVAKRKQRWLLTDSVKEDPGKHRTENYLKCAEPLGIEMNDTAVEVFPEREASEKWAALRRDIQLPAGPYVVMHPGGNWDLKRWPVERFAEVARHLIKKRLSVVICGSSGEKELSNEIAKLVGGQEVFSCAGRTDLGTLMAMMRESRYVLSGDSGPLHLAAGLGVPVVALYGPTALARTGPKSSAKQLTVEHRVGCEVPCYFQSCHYRWCMAGIGPSEVVTLCESLQARIERANDCYNGASSSNTR